MRTAKLGMACACLLLGLLAGCGGGGSSEPRAATGPGVVSFDAALPQSARAAIVELVSPSGSTPAGGSIPATDLESGRSLVFALDAAGNIRLAGTVEGADTVLSVDSTALALVKIALGKTQSKQQDAALSSAIVQLPAFARLRQALATSIDSGVPLGSDESTQDALHTLLAELPSGLFAAAPSSTRSHPLAIETTRPITQPPHVLVQGSLAFVPRSVVLSGTTAISHLAIKNLMPIQWTASSKDPNGTEIEAKPLPANLNLLPTELLTTAVGVGTNGAGVTFWLRPPRRSSISRPDRASRSGCSCCRRRIRRRRSCCWPVVTAACRSSRTAR